MRDSAGITPSTPKAPQRAGGEMRGEGLACPVNPDFEMDW